MHLDNKQAFKKFISTPLLKNVKDDFLLQKDDFEKIYRYEIEIEDVPDNYDLAGWLLGQEDSAKTYWSSRNKNFCIAGLGYADVFSNGLKSSSDYEYFIRDVFQVMESRISNSDKPIKYFGCLAFDIEDKISMPWESFGKFYFVLPKAELCKIKNKYYFAANVFYNPEGSKTRKELYDEIQSFIEKIHAGIYAPEEKKINYSGRQDNPDKSNWERNVNQVIATFDSEEIKKIVLSRKSVFKLKGNINPLLLFLLLKKNNINTYDFYFQNKDGNAFIGCTPELLFSRQGGKIYSEAVAGTILLGKNSIEEKTFGEDLLKSKKDSDEYRFVFNSVKSDLEKMCRNVNVVKKKEILKLSYAQHIYSQFEGNLKPGIDNFKIISTLNPTPAVSGYPKRNINALIKRYETFFRGFYAGPVGWIGKDSSEFAVGIRSGVVNDGYLSIYSGAGIVKKSSAESEWNEIENKISPFLKIIQNK
ncbi:isochorismate synthase [bacterium]|nr:isochorismate synthase [bacterium]